MFLDFLEKRSEEVDDTPRLTDEEKLFLKVFGIEEDQPAAAMKERVYGMVYVMPLAGLDGKCRASLAE